MAKDKRYTLTVKLNATSDRDLINWVEGIPDGERNQTVKNALRAALDLPIPAPPDPPEVAALRAQLAALSEAMEAWQAVGQNGADSDRVQYIEGWLNQMADAYNTLVRRVDNLASLPGAVLVSPEPVEAVPQMSSDEQQKRAKKLKNASW